MLLLIYKGRNFNITISLNRYNTLLSIMVFEFSMGNGRLKQTKDNASIYGVLIYSYILF